MSLVFVSYSRKDSAFVLRLVDILRQNRVPVWLDQHDIRVGDVWDIAIENALERASHILVVMSPTSVQSKNVRDEIDYAVEEGKVVVPIMVETCKPPLRLRRTQYTDFSDESNFDQALQRLLQTLAVHYRDTMEMQAARVETLTETVLDDAGLPALNLDTPSQHMYPELVMVGTDNPADRWIMKKEVMVLGREIGCDIVVPTDEISREHVAFHRTINGSYTIKDLDSRNGTWLNGERVEDTYQLNDGDEIVVALKVRLRYHAAAVGKDTAPLEVDPGLITEFLKTGKVQIFLNTLSRSVIVNGFEMKPPLTTQQYDLLELLANYPGEMVSRSAVAAALQSEVAGDVREDAVAAIVGALCNRLAEFDNKTEFVVTVEDEGFKLGDVKINKLKN